MTERLFTALVSAVGGVVLALWLIAGASAHQSPSGWQYPVECCSNEDCQAIPHHAVEITPTGYRVTLRPGEHAMSPAGGQWDLARDVAKPSPDGQYHICILPRSQWVMCFFAPLMGM